MAKRSPKPPQPQGRLILFHATITRTVNGKTTVQTIKHIDKQLVDGQWVDSTPTVGPRRRKGQR